ncbi:photolyase/blue-light receptor 2 [Perilla frutescens var. hirtella]|uniref:Photolyase/blue-light receptor 2 n=1 Tax=Perilla frutescens var. hirtella TaxID=608512 RepID=A0AAD4IZP2_PERFH|nr:photolyase/blue-light receptor 2 [Perilla frutescens var. hirtella]KAH6823968.1 photolyase/blue-light receptor 2 [Perilla frutescens var. hirtella]
MKMDSKIINDTETTDESQVEQTQNQNPFPLIPAASISLSLSTLIPSHFLAPKQIAAAPSKVRIPSQISSLSTLSLSSCLSPAKPFFKSNISANPLQNTLTLNPLRPSNPSGGAALRRSAVVWFRNDLRTHDNECLTAANNESISVLPVYCFDPRDYGKSSSGFDKTGPYRATFLIESVADLRKNLQARGSDLVVRIGRPENVLMEVVKAVGADAVYMHREVSHDEVKAEEKVEEAMKDEGVEVKYFWGSTLYHMDDLPFKLEEMPTNYGGFKEKVKGLDVRNTIEALDRMKGLPKRGDVESGEIPTLVDLGLNPNAATSQKGKTAANASLLGGETEAMQRLQTFAAEYKAQPNNKLKDGANDSIYGANFSCKISPWLAMGCLSPRAMFEELKKSASSVISAASNKPNGGTGAADTGMNWLMYELLWRDFFRFITRKYSSAKQPSYSPATACTGAAA